MVRNANGRAARERPRPGTRRVSPDAVLSLRTPVGGRLMARRRPSVERPTRTEREVLWDVVRTVSRWKSELPSGSPLLALLDGFEALSARLLKVPPEDFGQVLKKEKEVFQRAREEQRGEVDRAGAEPDGR